MAHHSAWIEPCFTTKKRVQVAATQSCQRHTYDCIVGRFNCRVRQVADLDTSDLFKTHADQVATSGKDSMWNVIFRCFPRQVATFQPAVY